LEALSDAVQEVSQFRDSSVKSQQPKVNKLFVLVSKDVIYRSITHRK